MEAKEAVLRELGLLVSAEADPEPENSCERGDRHVLYNHQSIWSWLPPDVARPFADSATSLPLFEYPDPQARWNTLLGRTKCFVLFGAARTPEFETLLRLGDVVKLVFEPESEQFDHFMENLEPKALMNAKAFFFRGDQSRFNVPLMQLLPPKLCDFGYPVFLVQQGLETAYKTYLDDFVERLETWYYRNKIYAFEGQAYRRSIPLRSMRKGLSFDQLRHLYLNLADHIDAGGVDDLENALAGRTAVCVAAGPDLDAKIPLLRQARGRAVVIAVNSALKTLLKHGLEPDFTVINDTSVDAARTLHDLPRLEKGSIVAHSLAWGGGESFKRRYFFGDFMPHLLGRRGNLLLHGSVITTAFALAEKLGCKRCVLVGAQLASHNEFGLSYARNTTYGEEGVIMPSFKNPGCMFPKLYPVRAADGRKMYTTINFRDVAFWFLDRIRMSNLEVVNTTAESILFGPGIVIDPDYAFDEPSDPGELPDILDRLQPVPPPMSIKTIRQFLQKEIAQWKQLEKDCNAVLERLDSEPDTALRLATGLVTANDANAVSYLLQRFRTFDNKYFHRLYFEGEEKMVRCEGAGYYCGWLGDMTRSLRDFAVNELYRLDKRSRGQ